MMLRTQPAAASRGRSRLPVLLTSAIAVAVLFWGLWWSHRVFNAERSEALSALADQRQSLELHVRQLLDEGLQRRFSEREASITAARIDPLCSADGLLLVDGAVQRLPRRFDFRSGAGKEVASLYAAIAGGSPSEEASETDTPWRERLDLIAQFCAAVKRTEVATIEKTFREFLEHRLHYRIDAENDLVSTAGLLDFFSTHGKPHRELLQQMILTGIKNGRGARMEGLAPALLRARSRMTRSEFLWIAERLAELADRHGIPTGGFIDRAQEESGDPLSFALSDLGHEPILVGGSWYAKRHGVDEWWGVAVDLGALRGEVESRLRSERWMTDSDEVRIAVPGHSAVPVAALDTTVISERWQRNESRIRDRYRLKNGLALFSGLAALAVAALALSHRSRRDRLLRLQAEFVATVSHELKTPLASARLIAETLQRRIGHLDAARDYPARMVRTVDSLSFLVDNILSFNRLEEGRVELDLEPMTLAEVADDLRETVSAGEAKPVVIEVVEGRRAWRADRELARLVFSNLARNACLYNDQESVQIRLESCPLEGSGEILVQDNGWGFSKQDRRQAFLRFFRSKDTQRRSRPGTGLGLSICAMVMELHGGSIEIDSTSPSGTTFRIRFPEPV